MNITLNFKKKKFRATDKLLSNDVFFKNVLMTNVHVCFMQCSNRRTILSETHRPQSFNISIFRHGIIFGSFLPQRDFIFFFFVFRKILKWKVEKKNNFFIFPSERRLNLSA